MKNYLLPAFLLVSLIVQDIQSQEIYKDLNKNGIKDLYEDPQQPVDKRVDDLINRMSLDEKVSLVVGMGMDIPGMTQALIKDKVAGQAGSTFPMNHLGIPSLILADGPAGLRIQPKRDSTSNQTYYCTAFPIATLLASTWDKELVERIGKAMGNEVKEYGVDILLAPALNIHRNPLAARNFEYFSEDPYLSGHMAAAIVNGVESMGVGTSVKHFAANNQETNRMQVNAIISERALREIYLRGFEIVVKESQPWTVMSSYNRLNDLYTSENADLLKTILREEWGFKGLVMTDWFGGMNPVEQMKAGNDLIMPGQPKQNEVIKKGLDDGSLNVLTLNENVKRILTITFQSPSFRQYAYSDKPNLDKNAALSREGAAEGIVLLKNNGVLPINTNSRKAAVFGNGSYEFVAGGSGSGDVNEAYTISLVQGLENAGFTLYGPIKNSYIQYRTVETAKLPKKKFFFELIPPISEMVLDIKNVEAAARQNELAFITIGRNCGESQDRKKEGDYYLTLAEKEMIKIVADSFHAQNKKVVMILNIGNVIETASWSNQVDGIVLAWQGGQEGGNAAADVITGKVNPSGKLPTTFPVDIEDIASSKNFPGKEIPGAKEILMGGMSMGTPSEVIYEEDIYIGYRFFDTFKLKTAYPFGYGLSYTTFKFDQLNLDTKQLEDKLLVRVRVTNSGKLSGREVVQLYLSAPKATMEKPEKELKGFAKTKLLNPGESQLVEITVPVRELASFSENRSSWIADAGVYEVIIGSSSADIKQVEKFTLPKEVVVEKVHKVLLPTRKINVLKQ